MLPPTLPCPSTRRTMGVTVLCGVPSASRATTPTDSSLQELPDLHHVVTGVEQLLTVGGGKAQNREGQCRISRKPPKSQPARNALVAARIMGRDVCAA